MVDRESGTYRPRRAFVEPDVEPDPPERPIQPAWNRTGNGSGNGPGNGNRNGAGLGSVRPLTDQDQPKPLYRDDARPNGSSRPISRAAGAPADPPTAETLMTPANLAPRQPSVIDDETTTILPRSRPTKHRTQALDAIDDFDDDERRPLGQRAKLTLLIGAVAVVVVIGLLIGFAVRSATNQSQSQSQSSLAPSGGGGSNSATQAPGQTGTALLSDAAMLSPTQAKAINGDRTWKVTTTQPGAEDGPTAACFGGEPLQGQPPPQQEVVRVLRANGKNPPLALHAATAYNSPEEASAAYAVASKTLGGCAAAGFWIKSGYLVSGIGNQALGVVVMEKVNGKSWRAHSVVLNRSGRVVNVVDAVQPSTAIATDSVAKALGQVNNVLCTAGGGECGDQPKVTVGPPPMGGDEPGFLAHGDLPPAGPKVYSWVATEVAPPKEGFKGSGCERVNWTTEEAKSRSSRAYLIQESGKNFFGLDEIVLTTKNAKAANKVVEEIQSNFSRCKRVQLTAEVARSQDVKSIGAQKTKISGWTAVVNQKTTQGTAKYRVGVVAAGPKVIYTFLNPRGQYDFTNSQWDIVAVRAGERATQVS
jgi:hypothetical protein